MKEKLYRAYEYFKNPSTGDYTEYRGRIVGYVKAIHSFEALDKLGLEGNEYGADHIDGQALERDLKAMSDEKKELKKLSLMAVPFVKEYTEEKEALKARVDEAYEEYKKEKEKA